MKDREGGWWGEKKGGERVRKRGEKGVKGERKRVHKNIRSGLRTEIEKQLWAIKANRRIILRNCMEFYVNKFENLEEIDGFLGKHQSSK